LGTRALPAFGIAYTLFFFSVFLHQNYCFFLVNEASINLLWMPLGFASGIGDTPPSTRKPPSNHYFTALHHKLLIARHEGYPPARFIRNKPLPSFKLIFRKRQRVVMEAVIFNKIDIGAYFGGMEAHD